MLLTFNIGNKEINLGLINDGVLKETVCVSCSPDRTADEYACTVKSAFDLRGIECNKIDGAIGTSVAPLITGSVKSALEFLLGIRVHMLGAGTKTGLNILTDDPSQLGGDLVAAAVGALSKYNPPMILVDFGVATTFSVLNKDGAFIGCAIAPGVSVSSEALTHSATLLPSVSSTAPKKCIATNTNESMKSGLILGSASMVDGMIGRIEKELGCSAGVIASGGSTADLISANCSRNIIRDDTLLLSGLAVIYEKNAKR